jgi:UDP:flavonoid glycosyltransferase YjiC (YdhE family)
MATFLFAWELGMGAGHCVNLFPLAKGISDRGHTVYVAARDLSAARHVFGSLPVHYLAAAYMSSRMPNAVALPRTFADILHNTGFGDQETLEAITSAWRHLFVLVRPDVVICEHSPMALLASHVLGIRRVVVGTGFFSPPDVSPLPDLRDGLRPPTDVLNECEVAVLQRVNRVLEAAGKPALPRLSSLYAEVDSNFLLTFEELDHYSQRSQTEYWGMWCPTGGRTPVWPEGSGPRVFAYLKPPIPNWKLGDVLNILRQSLIRAVICVSGADDNWLNQFQTPSMSIFTDRLNVREIARQCDFAILNGNAGTATELLLHGVPQLHIPIFLEQATFTRRVTDLGAGLMAESNRPDQFVTELAKMQTSSSYRDAALRFANRYVRYDPDVSMSSILDRIELLVVS